LVDGTNGDLRCLVMAAEDEHQVPTKEVADLVRKDESLKSSV